MPDSLPVLDPTVDFSTFAQFALDAISSGNASLIVAVVLIGVVAVFRMVFSEKLPFLKTDLGAALFTFVLGFLGAGATALAAGSALNGDLLLSALKVTFAAMGGFATLKKIALPLLDKLLSKLGFPTIADAEKAGEEAVQANPGKGISEIVPYFKEIP